jgi:hypothetical protein
VLLLIHFDIRLFLNYKFLITTFKRNSRGKPFCTIVRGRTREDLGAFEDRVLMRILGTMREKVMEG